MKNTTKGQFLKYKNEEHVSVWAGETCNRINGTDLSINPPLPIPIPSLYVFTMELCRSLRLDFERPSMLNGLVTLRYSAPMDMFHPTKENECFCPVVMNDEDEDVIQCLKAGLFDMTPCLKGVMYISSPHFLYGDPELLSFASKLNPDREKHGIFVEMEPVIKFLGKDYWFNYSFCLGHRDVCCWSNANTIQSANKTNGRYSVLAKYQ